MQEAAVPNGGPGQVAAPREGGGDKLGPVHGPPWSAFALRSGVRLARGGEPVAVRLPINDQLRTGTDLGNPTV